MAGALGIEPRMTVPKTVALPLGYAPAGVKVGESRRFGFGFPVLLIMQD